MTVIQIVNIYSKGVTLKEVNQLGMSLSQDMQSSINAASPLSVGESGADFRQILAPDSTEVAGARLCTGTVSYIWNYGRFTDRPVNVYESGDDLIRLVKVDDKGKLYCSDPEKKVIRDNATEVFKDGERDIVLHSFTIAEVAEDPALQQALYRITLEVGTNDQDALRTDPTAGVIDSIDTSCKPPSEEGSFQDYCSVNKFEFTARVGNRGEI